MTYIANLAKVKVDLHAKDEGRRSNGSTVRAHTNGQADKQTDATKCIISLASWSINMTLHCQYSLVSQQGNPREMQGKSWCPTRKWFSCWKPSVDFQVETLKLLCFCTIPVYIVSRSHFMGCLCEDVYVHQTKPDLLEIKFLHSLRHGTSYP